MNPHVARAPHIPPVPMFGPSMIRQVLICVKLLLFGTSFQLKSSR